VDILKKNYHVCRFMLLILTAFLLAMSGIRRNEEALASRIAPKILRFHVLANSDTPEDQALKLEVKDYLLNNIREELSADAHISLDSDPIGRDMLLSYITDHQHTLERGTEQFMAQRGFSYPAKIYLETCEFPQKTYGDMTFPAGTYEAVRVVLGNGEGQNFWCVLYPSLCYIDSTYAVVPDSSKNLLQALVSEDDFYALMKARQFTFINHEKKSEQDPLLPQIKIRFKLTEIFD